MENIFLLLSQHHFKTTRNDSNDYKCIICRKILSNACQATCGCNYCQKCVEEQVRSGIVFCPGDTEECKIANLSNVFIDQKTNKQISQLVVKCPEEMCCYESQLRHIGEHLRLCEKKSVECPFTDFGCNQGKLKMDKLNEHMQQESYRHNEILIDVIGNLRNELKRDREKYDMAIDELMKSDREKAVIIESVKSENGLLKQRLDCMENILDGKADETALEQRMNNLKNLFNGKADNASTVFDGQSGQTKRGKCSKVRTVKTDQVKNCLTKEIDAGFVWIIDNIAEKRRHGDNFVSAYFNGCAEPYKMRLRCYIDGIQLLDSTRVTPSKKLTSSHPSVSSTGINPPRDLAGLFGSASYSVVNTSANYPCVNPSTNLTSTYSFASPAVINPSSNSTGLFGSANSTALSGFAVPASVYKNLTSTYSSASPAVLNPPGPFVSASSTGVNISANSTGLFGSMNTTGLFGTASSTGVNISTGTTAIFGSAIPAFVCPSRSLTSPYSSASPAVVNPYVNSTGLFVTASSTGVNISTSSTGLFGSTNTAGLFGSANTTGLFGSVNTSGLFGSVNTSGIFGSANTTGLFGSANTTGLFGSVNTTGLFGSVNTTGIFGSANTTGLFGSANTTGLFGSASSAVVNPSTSFTGVNRPRTSISVHRLHIYLYIDAGVNDQSLKWPFKRKVTIEIMDQMNRDAIQTVTKYCTIARPLIGSSEINFPFLFDLNELSKEQMLQSDHLTVHCVIHDE